jgi:Tfp pilus assembly protein PilO
MKCIKKICFLTIFLSFPLAGNLESKVQAEISYGELIDKITILRIKSERIADLPKLKNIFIELASLLTTLEEQIGYRSDIIALMGELKKTNEALWDVEDLLRLKERAKDFSDEFIQLARTVYITNDHRFTLKKKIDVLLGSRISEEKSYESYQ